jgi:hypothetical protein
VRDAVATVTQNMLQATWKESNIVWISVVPPRESTLKFIEKVIYTLIVSLCKGITDKCVQYMFPELSLFYFGYLSPGSLRVLNAVDLKN